MNTASIMQPIKKFMTKIIMIDYPNENIEDHFSPEFRFLYIDIALNSGILIWKHVPR